MPTLIEPAVAGDALAIAQIHVNAWRAAYAGIVPDDHLAALSVEQRCDMWRQAIADGAPELLVARRAGRVIGWVSSGPSRDDGAPPDAGEIWAIYLNPRQISTGAGRALWLRARERLIERGFRSAMLWVLGGKRARSTSTSAPDSCSTPARPGASRSAAPRSKSCATPRRSEAGAPARAVGGSRAGPSGPRRSYPRG